MAARLAGNMTGAIAAVDGGRTRDLAVHVTPITFVSRPPKSLRQKLAHGGRGANGGRSWWAHFEFTRINITPTILPKKIEEQLVSGAIGLDSGSFCLWKYQEGKTRNSDPTTVTAGASMRMTRHLATSRPDTAAPRVTATIPAVATSSHAWNKKKHRTR